MFKLPRNITTALIVVIALAIQVILPGSSVFAADIDKYVDYDNKLNKATDFMLYTTIGLVGVGIIIGFIKLAGDDDKGEELQVEDASNKEKSDESWDELSKESTETTMTDFVLTKKEETPSLGLYFDIAPDFTNKLNRQKNVDLLECINIKAGITIGF